MKQSFLERNIINVGLQKTSAVIALHSIPKSTKRESKYIIPFHFIQREMSRNVIKLSHRQSQRHKERQREQARET